MQLPPSRPTRGTPIKSQSFTFLQRDEKKNRNTSYFHSMQSDCQSFLNSPLLTFVSTFLWVSTGRSVLLSPNLFIMAYKCNEYHLGSIDIDTMTHYIPACLWRIFMFQNVLWTSLLSDGPLLIVLFSRMLCDFTPPCQSVGQPVGSLVSLLLLRRLWAFWNQRSCPNALVTFSFTASAHPHATGEAVYPALF